MAMQIVLEEVGLTDDNKKWMRVKARMDDSKPRIIGPGGIEIRNRLAAPTITWAQAAAEEGIDINLKKNIRAEIDKVEDILKRDLPKGPDGRLTSQAESLLAKRRKNLEKIATQEVNKGRSNYSSVQSALEVLSKNGSTVKANVSKNISRDILIYFRNITQCITNFALCIQGKKKPGLTESNRVGIEQLNCIKYDSLPPSWVVAVVVIVTPSHIVVGIVKV
jgi:hypothetical protein